MNIPERYTTSWHVVTGGRPFLRRMMTVSYFSIAWGRFVKAMVGGFTLGY